MTLFARSAGCVVAGLATSLAFPPQSVAGIAWVGLAPWLVSLHRVRLREAALLSGIFGFALTLPLGAWLPGVVTRGFLGSAEGGYWLWLLAGSAYVPAIVLLGVGLRVVAGASALFPLAAGLGWGLVELSYSFVWPEVPWVQIGATQIDTPLAPLASVIGVHGLSALIVAANGAGARLLLRISPIRTAVVAGGVAIAAVLAGAIAKPAPTSEPRTLRVALVQPAIPVRAHFSSVVQDESAAELLALSRGLGDLDLILWPENALASTLEGRPDLAARVAELASALGVPIWVGMHRNGPEGRYNSVAAFARGRKPEPIYDKARLLPFSERIPAWLPVSARHAWGTLLPPLPFQPGELHATTNPRAALFVCFEATFSGLERDARAELLVNLVNDGWYDRTAAAEHLLLLSRWRAIEAGASLVRVATTGISAVVRPSGEVAASIPVRKRSVLVAEIPLQDSVTLFERVGYAPLLVGALVCWGLAFRSRAAARLASPRSAQ